MVKRILDSILNYPLPAIVAGIGLAFVAMQSLVFSMQIAGYVLIASAVFIALLQGQKVSLGPKWAYIPILLIVGSVVARAVVYQPDTAIYELGFMGLMFGAYMAGRVCGKQLFWAVAPMVIIISISVYISAFTFPGKPTGGILDGLNYNLTAATLIIGTLIATWDRKWLLVVIALPAVFLTGATEGIVVLGIVGLMVLLRADWNIRMLVPAGAVGIALIVLVGTGALGSLHSRTGEIAEAAINGEESGAISNRLDGYKFALQDVSILGHGYQPLFTDRDSIHNVPLRVLYELGPVAMLAWCGVIVMGVVKGRYKYAIGAIIVFSMFDHLAWTWLAPFSMAIVGASTIEDRNDLLFRRQE